MQCPNCTINNDADKRKCKCGYDYESGLIVKENDHIYIKTKRETKGYEVVMFVFGIVVAVIINKYIKSESIDETMYMFAVVGAISGLFVGIIFNGKDPMHIATGYAGGVIYYLYKLSSEFRSNKVLFMFVMLYLMLVGGISAAAAHYSEKAYIYVKSKKA